MDDDLDIEATCSPDFDLPRMQNIDVRATYGDSEVARLRAVRLAQSGFTPDDMDWVVAAFDEHTAFAYGLAVEMRRSRRALAKQYEETVSFSVGFIGVLKVHVDPTYRGRRIGMLLLRYLRDLHAGMCWYAGLQAAPLEIENGQPGYREARRRLVAYYSSDAEMGFKQAAPRSSPGLMTALWDQEG